ncbi:hypothetical protein BGZ94_000018 [Podila epigama]|nr:hypothetical protein BGZ94_000018 [Podila epigama]
MTFRRATLLLFLNWILITTWMVASFESTDATIVVMATNDTYIDRTAAFGPQIPEEGLVLSLIAVETLQGSDQSACAPVTGAPANVSWVALVERGGDCGFAEKVRNMQVSGASAVIVGDDRRGGLITMYAREDTYDITIPSVFITQNHYRELRYLGMELGKGFAVRMTPDDEDWPLMDVLSFIILSPAFVILFLYFLVRVRIHQQRKADLAPTEVVSRLPVKIFFKSKVRENDPVECVICLEEYEDEDELRVLPCKHEYHVACVDNWLTTRKKFCPICKRDICVPTESTPLLSSMNSQPSYDGSEASSDTHNDSSTEDQSTTSTTLESRPQQTQQESGNSNQELPTNGHSESRMLNNV